MNEKKLKHLEFIHNTINRMSTNSFIIKGWCVTLIAALYALAEKDSNENYIIITYFPIIIFWLLNAYFLKLERQFRSLYNDVITKNEASIDFSMKIDSYSTGKNKFESALLSKSLILFYIPQITVSIIIMFIKK